MKFSICDLFLVTVIVVLVLGWWLDHRTQNRDAMRQDESWQLIVERQIYKQSVLRARLNEYESPTLPNSQAPAANPLKK